MYLGGSFSMHACAVTGKPDHGLHMDTAACAACEPGAQGSARRGDAAQSAADAGTAPAPGMPASGLGQGLGSGRASTEAGPTGMLAPGAQVQQGRLSGELCAGHEGAVDCDERCAPRQCRPEGLASATGGASADAQRASGQAGPAAGTEDGDAEEGWSDFMG